jgi:hypothetical protein
VHLDRRFLTVFAFETPNVPDSGDLIKPREFRIFININLHKFDCGSFGGYLRQQTSKTSARGEQFTPEIHDNQTR